MGRRAVALLVAALMVAGTLQQVKAQTTTPMTLMVYNDGTAAITQVVSALPNDTSIDLQLLSSVIADPVVYDQNGSSLYFQITGSNITVYTIGATEVTLQYDTAALTSKQGTVWTLAFQAYYNTTVVLPQQSTLTSISGTPDSLSTSNGSPVVVVSPGDWQMDYGLPIQVTSTSTVSSTSSSSVVTASSSTSSLSTSSSGTSSATKSSSTTSSGSGQENSTITTNTSGGPPPTSTTTGQISISTLLSSTSSLSSPTTSSSTTSSASAQGPTSSGGIPTTYLAVVLIAAVVAALLLLVIRERGGRTKTSGAPQPSETTSRPMSELRPDDVKVIEFILEKGGKVLEPEIRIRFALPKTSAWRQIKRLERLGYVSVTKVGSQNQVELLKDAQGNPAI